MMSEFIIIYRRNCPNYFRMLSILQWQKLNYHGIEVENQAILLQILSKYNLDDNTIKFIHKNFIGSVILYKNFIIHTGVLLLIILQQEEKFSHKIQLNLYFEIIAKELWIDNNILYSFFLLSIANYELVYFHSKQHLIMEKTQVGNDLLIKAMESLEIIFNSQPWFGGNNYTICDISLFFFIKSILYKNPNLLCHYHNLEIWYQRMVNKKNFFEFL